MNVFCSPLVVVSLRLIKPVPSFYNFAHLSARSMLEVNVRVSVSKIEISFTKQASFHSSVEQIKRQMSNKHYGQSI